MGVAEGQRAGAVGVWLQSGGVGVNKAGAESQGLGAGFQRVSAGDDVVHEIHAHERERAMLAHGDAVVFNILGVPARHFHIFRGRRDGRIGFRIRAKGA